MLIKPTAFLTFSLPSPSSLLKLPIVTIYVTRFSDGKSMLLNCTQSPVSRFTNGCCYSLSKLKRQRAQQVAKRVKLVQAVDQANFAKETVSSILKKAPPGEGLDKIKTPPRTPTKEGPRTPERDVVYVSPRTQRRECERQVNILQRNYSQTCIRRSPLGNGQVTA